MDGGWMGDGWGMVTELVNFVILLKIHLPRVPREKTTRRGGYGDLQVMHVVYLCTYIYIYTCIYIVCIMYTCARKRRRRRRRRRRPPLA